MYFLCFSIRENKIAIKVKDIYKLIHRSELNTPINPEYKSIYYLTHLESSIPIFNINNSSDITDKDIIIINSDNKFGLFIDSIDKSYKNKILEDHKLITKQELETLVKIS